MYRIRFHGRGGQGIKTAGRILGTAFFMEKYEVQDAPRYGAERRGAPIFAYVRASRDRIKERGIIRKPDIIVAADESLIPMSQAAVLSGARQHTVLLINSGEKAGTWSDRLDYPGRILTVSPATSTNAPAESPPSPQDAAIACVGAAARITGVISRESLQSAIDEEAGKLSRTIREKITTLAMNAYDSMHEYAGCVTETAPPPVQGYTPPRWVDAQAEEARISAPAIHAEANSAQVNTGLWRTMRPVIDYSACHKCWWTCSTLCPDSAITLREDGYPKIDYTHCKGCMICLERCTGHCMTAITEIAAQAQERGGQK